MASKMLDDLAEGDLFRFLAKCMTVGSIAGLILFGTGFICGRATAGELYSRNMSGGLIILTDQPCVIKDRPQEKAVFATDPSGLVVYGCWHATGTKIYAEFTDGDVVTLSPEGFVKKKEQLFDDKVKKTPLRLRL